MSRMRFAILSVLLFSMTGCLNPKRIYTEVELRSIASEKLTAMPASEFDIPFKITSEMHAFAKQATRDSVTAAQKAIALVEAMISHWELEITYDKAASLTARDVFLLRYANCMSFTNLFIGLSRSIGMETVYVDVPQVHSYYNEGNIILNNGHMCAGLWDGAEFYLVDFSPDPEKHYRIYNVIDDLEAIAHHYNNMGYRILHDDPSQIQEAIRHYMIATEIKPGFPQGNNNLGAAYASLGDYQKAEIHYRQALNTAPAMAEANCNLGSIFFAQGKMLDARNHFARAVSSSKNNSHYHYRYAMACYYLGDLREAMKHFLETIRIDETYTNAYLGLALIAEKSSDYRSALMHLVKATALNPAQNEAYSRYTNLLLRTCLGAGI